MQPGNDDDNDYSARPGGERDDGRGRAHRSSYAVLHRCQLRSRLFVRTKALSVDGVVRLACPSGFNRLPGRGQGVGWCSRVVCGDNPQRVVAAGVRARLQFVLLVVVPGSGICQRLDGSSATPNTGVQRSVRRRGQPADDWIRGQTSGVRSCGAVTQDSG